MATTSLRNGQIARLLRRRLFLFVSVDVVGSVTIKRQKEEDWAHSRSKDWLEAFGLFLTYFPKELEAAYFTRKKIPKLQTWKSIGDELVFYVQLQRSKEAETHLRALMTALKSFSVRDYFPGLPLKTTAWLAGVPVGNVELPVFRRALKDGGRPDRVDSAYFECIGPSVDLGFRLAKHSSTRHLTVSPELAYLLLKAEAKFPFHYSGRQPLKGIMEENGGCPHIWIDLSPPKPGSAADKEEALMGRREAAHPALLKFCRTCICRHGVPRFLPFIPGDRYLGEMPSNKMLDRKTEQRRRTFRLLFQESAAWRDQLRHISPRPTRAASKLSRRFDKMVPPAAA